MNLLTLSILYITCHSVIIEDFKVYSDCIFAEDLWISHDITFFTIPCVSHDSIFAIDLMRRSWIHWCCRFHTSIVTQFSVMISRSTGTLFSMMIYRSALTYRFWQVHASAMTLFLLSIWFVLPEFIDVVDSIRHLSLSIHWRFQRLKRLSFRWWLMDQKWHNVSDNSMRQPWHYFCYLFDVYVVNSFKLSFPYVSWHSVFNDDFLVHSDSVFADNVSIRSDKAFLTIPCVSITLVLLLIWWIVHEFIDVVDSTR